MPSLREIEADSIRTFVQACADQGHLKGRVLDYGCGRQPYRKIVEAAGGIYHPYDRRIYNGSTVHTDVGADDPLRRRWDAILCTQVVQYMDPGIFGGEDGWLHQMRDSLNEGGMLVMTGPTNWPVVENDDLWRMTATGMGLQLEDWFEDYEVVERAHVEFEGERWPLGWQAIAAR